MGVNLEIVRGLVRRHEVTLPDDVNDWPEDWQDEFEERAAIMEYDGNLSRDEAEQWAETIIRAFHGIILGSENVELNDG